MKTELRVTHHVKTEVLFYKFSGQLPCNGNINWTPSSCDLWFCRKQKLFYRPTTIAQRKN